MIDKIHYKEMAVYKIHQIINFSIKAIKNGKQKDN
uniref:Uncharacterized protein n=1 Tax=viral metagenome TaxID=1070528 RepID=A0A6C0JW11_9ZZZZ